MVYPTEWNSFQQDSGAQRNTFKCFAPGGGLVVPWHGLTLSFGVLAPDNCRPSSAATCALPMANWYELQSGLQMGATCAGLGGIWERPSEERRLAAASASLGPLSKRYRAC